MREGKKIRKPELADAKELQSQSRRLLRKLGKGFVNTWKLYKSSKIGVAGLAIVVGFLIMAIFAPWIAPYDRDFRAPSLDVFIADYANLPLVEEYNWTKVVGLTSEERNERPLERIMVYSDEGKAKVFPVERGISNISGELGIVVKEPSIFTVPAHSWYLEYAHFSRGSIIFFMNTTTIETPNGTKEVSSLYEYTYSIAYQSHINLPFVAKYRSNLWNGYSRELQTLRLAMAFADDHNVWLMDKRPPTQFDTQLRTYNSSITIENATIVGNLLVVDGEFKNGSMMIVPTDVGIMAYDLNVTKSTVTGTVTNVTIGDMRWLGRYEFTEDIETVPFEPVIGDNMISFRFPQGPTTEDGKEQVILPTKDGRAVGYDRETGNITWAHKLIFPTIRDFELTSVYPAPTYAVMVGRAGDRALIAALDTDTGLIGENNTVYATIEGYMNSEPHYVRGLSWYTFSTDQGTIYLMSQLLKVNATFAIPGESAIPVSFLGNIYIQDSIAGNYFGVVTRTNSLFIETLSGVNIAPLPPGKYPSGNRYLLGTDYEGHDILSLLIYATAAELNVGVTAAFFSVVIGTIVGLVAGFYGGLIDGILMRITDVTLSLPYLVIMLLFAAVFGPSLWNIIIIIAILSWAFIARVIRSVTLSLKERAFVDAAIVAGASDSRLIFRHIGPNVLPYTFLYMTFGISGAIVTEAILAFLGFGDPNNMTWGMMLQYLQISGHSLDAPWWLLPPGIAITLLSLAFYLIGRAFDEVVNPRLRRR